MSTRFSKTAVIEKCALRAERIIERWHLKRADGWDQIVRRAQREKLNTEQIISMAVDYGRKEAYMEIVGDIEGGYL